MKRRQVVNQYRGETPFEVDGTAYFLVFTMSALAALEAAWKCVRVGGETPEEWEAKRVAFSAAMNNPTHADLVTCFRVGLDRWAKQNRNGQGSLPDEEVAEILDQFPTGFLGARLLYYQALQNSMSPEKQAPEDQDPNVQGQPGTLRTS